MGDTKIPDASGTTDLITKEQRDKIVSTWPTATKARLADVEKRLGQPIEGQTEAQWRQEAAEERELFVQCGLPRFKRQHQILLEAADFRKTLDNQLGSGARAIYVGLESNLERDLDSVHYTELKRVTQVGEENELMILIGRKN